MRIRDSLRGVKQAEQPLGRCHEQHTAHCHDHKADPQADAQGMLQALAVAGAIAEAHDGHGALGQATGGHEHEGLELVVDAEQRHRCVGEADEDGIEPHYQHAAPVSYTHLG